MIQLKAMACCQDVPQQVCSLLLSLYHVAKSSSLRLIGDTYLDLFACGGCGYRLSLVIETPTPYVVLRRDSAHACCDSEQIAPCRDGESESLRWVGGAFL